MKINVLVDFYIQLRNFKISFQCFRHTLKEHQCAPTKKETQKVGLITRLILFIYFLELVI